MILISFNRSCYKLTDTVLETLGESLKVMNNLTNISLNFK